MLKSHFAIGPIALAALATLMPEVSQAASDPKGVWLNDTGRGAVEIKNCGGALCGHVVWVKDGADAKGCGKQIIGEARPAGGANWGNGWIYSPEKKRRYDVELTPVGEDKLRVVGYAGVKLFSRTMIWKRAPADLQRCGSNETVAKAEAPKEAPAAPAAVTRPDVNAPDVKAPEVKAPELKSPVATSPAAKTTDVNPAEKKAPDLTSPTANPQQQPATPKPETAAAGSKAATSGGAEPASPSVSDSEAASKPDSGSGSENDKTAEADEQSDGADDDLSAAVKKFDLGDIDVSKFLKRTRSGNCKLDLPWVKIEIGCE